MAWVNMYATVSDSNGYFRSTSSRRGQVNKVSANINSVIGPVASMNASYVEEVMPDMGTISKERREAVKEDVLDRREVRIDINIEANPKFIIYINGINIPVASLQSIAEYERKKFEIQLESLQKVRQENPMKALAMAQTIMNR